MIVDQDLIILDEENDVAITEFLSQVVESEPPLIDMSMYLEHRLYIFLLLRKKNQKSDRSAALFGLRLRNSKLDYGE